jgi:hypothetical protein
MADSLTLMDVQYIDALKASIREDLGGIKWLNH